MKWQLLNQPGFQIMIKGFITAITTLTRIPIKGKDTGNFASSLPWFPVVGFLLAMLVSGVILLLRNITNQSWNEATAIFIILLSSLLTGALHLDGFADWADSLGALNNKEKMLKIMKDSNSGVFGVVALILLLLAKWIVLTKLLELNLIIVALFVSYVASRFSMVYLSVTLPYARTTGGTGERFVKEAKYSHLILAFFISIILLFLIGNILAVIFFLFGFPIIYLWKRWCKNNLSGVTGDLLGAGSEIIEVSILFLIALFYNSIQLFIN